MGPRRARPADRRAVRPPRSRAVWCTLATGGDGGGSIRIPAAFTGLPGLKTTYGRIPKGPEVFIGSLTATSGCLSRSVRDIARYLDVVQRLRPARPEQPAARRRMGGRTRLVRPARDARAVVSPNLGVAHVDAEVADRAVASGRSARSRSSACELVDMPVKMPELGLEWALAGLAEIRHDLGDAYPECADDLTPQIAFGLEMAEQMYNLESRASRIEAMRTRMNETMAELFDQVDFVIARRTPTSRSARRARCRPRSTTSRPGREQRRAHDPVEHLRQPGHLRSPPARCGACPSGCRCSRRTTGKRWLLDLARLVERERPGRPSHREHPSDDVTDFTIVTDDGERTVAATRAGRRGPRRARRPARRDRLGAQARRPVPRRRVRARRATATRSSSTAMVDLARRRRHVARAVRRRRRGRRRGPRHLRRRPRRRTGRDARRARSRRCTTSTATCTNGPSSARRRRS